MDDVPEVQRALFLQALDTFVAAAKEDAAHLGLLLIDLTNLSRINHHHGYSTGDLMLATAHQQLLGVSKLPDTVFRVGSHRFAFILPGLSNPAFIALALNKVTRLLEGELFVDSGMVSVDLKIGLSINHSGSRDPMAMLALAESSLAHVKLGGSHRLDDMLREDGRDQVDYQLEQRFAQALRDNDFELYYQPKVDLLTGRVASVEALLRWNPEDSEPVPPEMVVGLAEAAGRAYELTKWVVHRAMRQLKDWQDELDVGLAFNIQAGLVGSPDLPSLVRDAIAIWGVDPAKVTVEITEDAIIEDKETGLDNLLQLKELGVNLAIDDFGTGYSSLSYFKHIPAAELKIDKSFVSSMLVDSQDLELVKIMIHIAHQFGMSVVAEGVEDRETLEHLRALGCDYVQGYYVSRPLPEKEFKTWMHDWPGLPAVQ